MLVFLSAVDHSLLRRRVPTALRRQVRVLDLAKVVRRQLEAARCVALESEPKLRRDQDLVADGLDCLADKFLVRVRPVGPARYRRR
jgi:hypothetical protein